MILKQEAVRLQRIHVVLLVLIFMATRGWALHAGFHYLGNETTFLVQIMDLEVLHHHLLRGLLHLHGQPPLFNAAIGLALKWRDASFGSVMLGLQLALSLAAGVAVYLTLLRLAVSAWVSFGVSLFLLLNPALVLYEFDALYTVMVYALHCLIALSLVSFVRTRSSAALWWLVGLMVTMTLLRSSYQWVWVGMVAGLLWWQMPESRRKIVRAGVVGVVLAMAWPAKNYVLFRHFTSTTWGPYSVSRHWPGPPYQEPVQGWVRQGLLPTFDRPDVQMEPQWLDRNWPAPRTGAPELDDSRKPSGAPNWNALSRLKMLEQQEKDDWFLLRRDPRDYARMVLMATLFYFRPSSDYFVLGYPWWFWDPSVDQYRRVAGVDRVVEALCCGIVTLSPAKDAAAPRATPVPGGGRLSSLCVGAVVGHVLVLGCLFSFFFAKRLWEGRRELRIAVMTLTLTVTYLFVVVSLVEAGEGMRFRFETHALVVMVAVVFLQQIGDRWTAGREIAEDRRNPG